MVEKKVDLLVSSKLKEQGYTDSSINYGYSLPANGNNDFIPDKGKKYSSKAGKNTRSEFEFLIFAGKGKQKSESLILVEDKDEISKLGNEKDITDKKRLSQMAVTDGCHRWLLLCVRFII